MNWSRNWLNGIDSSPDHGWSILTVLAVCSAGAASPVAEETDAGDTMCWSYRAPFCVSAGLVLRSPVSLPLSGGVGSGYFCTSCGQLQGPPPACCIDVDRLRVSLADIRVTHPSETSGSLPALHRGCLLGCGHRSCAGHVPAKPAPSALPKQSVHAGKTSTRQDLDVGHSVFPVYARRMILRWKVSSLLSCLTHSPCLAALQQCAEDTCVVDCHPCFHSQHGIYPHTSREAGESCSCLSDPLVDMYRYVQGEVVGDSGAKVHKLTDNIKFVVVDGDDW